MSSTSGFRNDLTISMAIAEKPTLVFVPGAWHPPSCYDIIINILSSAPYFYPCVAVTTPTVGAEPPTLTLPHDVDAIRAVTARLADDGKEILLVMHSYGGLPGSQSCEGLAKSEMERQGKKGGLIALVYIAAFIVPEGTAAATRETLPPIIDVMGDYGRILDPIPMFYNDVEPSLAARHVAKLAHHSIPALISPVSHGGYKHIPSTYVFCENDAAVVLEVQKAVVARVEAEEQVFGGSFKKVFLPSGHSPFLSMPDRVIEIIEMAIQEAKCAFISD